MRSLEERIVRVSVNVPGRRTEEVRPGDEPSIIHICLEGARRLDGAPTFFDLEMNEFIPPDDDSTIVVLLFPDEQRL